MSITLAIFILVILAVKPSTVSLAEVRRPGQNKIDIRAAVLLPGNNDRLFSIQKVC
jgi:hypothetical protein